MSNPVGWGSTYCFTAVGVGVGVLVGVGVTSITKAPPAQIFFGWHVFCSPGHWLLISAMTLTFGSRSSFESVFCSFAFFHYFVKSMRWILIKHIDIWHMTLLLLTFN